MSEESDRIFELEDQVAELQMTIGDLQDELDDAIYTNEEKDNEIGALKLRIDALEAAEAECDGWKSALIDLTPLDRETATPESCDRWIRDYIAGAQKAISALQDALQPRIDEIRARYAPDAEGASDESD